MVKFPLPDPSITELSSVADSWAHSASIHEWTIGADEAAISAVESTLGRRLPSALRAIYKMSDGIGLLQGNLVIEPLRPPKEDSFGLIDYSDKLREWKWPIPEELIAFGGNGSDELFGVWLPTERGPGHPHPIIEVGEIFEDKSFAVVGTDLCKFLTIWTAFYTMLCLPEISTRKTKKALDALGVPANLRIMNPDEVDEELYGALSKWADPTLPDYNPDPYDRGLTAEQLRASYGQNFR